MPELRRRLERRRCRRLERRRCDLPADSAPPACLRVPAPATRPRCHRTRFARNGRTCHVTCVLTISAPPLRTGTLYRDCRHRRCVCLQLSSAHYNVLVRAYRATDSLPTHVPTCYTYLLYAFRLPGLLAYCTHCVFDSCCTHYTRRRCSSPPPPPLSLN